MQIVEIKKIEWKMGSPLSPFSCIICRVKGAVNFLRVRHNELDLTFPACGSCSKLELSELEERLTIKRKGEV